MERLTIKASSGLIHLKDNTEMTMNVAIKKLSDFEDLEEQNRLLKLPCAVGDTYYRIENDGANPPYISEWEVHTIEFCVNVRDNIGKTVFLAREEAEAALEELERGKGE